MFQFSGFALLSEYYVFNIVGCPIRISADQFVCADPRSFSQLITSFFASESLGIPHTPLFCLLYYYCMHYCTQSVLSTLLLFSYLNMSMNRRGQTDLSIAARSGEYRSRTDDLPDENRDAPAPSC